LSPEGAPGRLGDADPAPGGTGGFRGLALALALPLALALALGAELEAAEALAFGRVATEAEGATEADGATLGDGVTLITLGATLTVADGGSVAGAAWTGCGGGGGNAASMIRAR